MENSPQERLLDHLEHVKQYKKQRKLEFRFPKQEQVIKINQEQERALKTYKT